MEHFCVNPYFYRLLHDNQVRPCCWLQRRPDVQRVHKDILADVPSPDCKKCWTAEAAGIKSKRQIDNDNLVRLTGQTLEQLKTQAQTHEQVISWQIKLSNDCNLACKTCYAEDSTSWYNEHNFYNPKHQFKKVVKIQPDSMDYINFEAVKHIEFLGGEPFITRLHVPFLQRLLEKGNTDLQLCYTTNGMKLPDADVVNILQQFKNVVIKISIDGIGSRFEYLRWPADWNQLQDNISWYKSKFTDVSCAHVLSSLTIGYLDEFLPYALGTFGAKKLTFNIVDHPYYLAPNVLPEEIKHDIYKKFRQSKFWPILEQYADLMLPKANNFTLGRLAVHLLRQDQYRNQNIKDFLPEIVFFNTSRPLRKSSREI